MNRTGHLGVGLLIYTPVFALFIHADSLFLGLIGLVIVLWTAPLPDIDLRIPGLTHRGPTHTVAFAVVVGLAWTLLGWVVGGYVEMTVLPVLTGLALPAAPLSWQRLLHGLHTIDRGSIALLVGSSGLLGIVSHLLADVLTPAGITPFWPLSSSHHSLGLCRASNRAANTLLFVLGASTIVLSLLLLL